MSERATKSERFIVVRSQSGRSSCWPESRVVPDGWTVAAMGGSTIGGTREQCMEAIQAAHSRRQSEPPPDRRFKLSLMFFGDSESDPSGNKYRLLLESSRFADQQGFQGVWLPERHFTRFGCLYPAPAVIHAAIARETRSLRLRAGSVVMPLNDPARVAEQWSVVDNLSDGRIEIAFASGWHPDDFALMPDAYSDRNERMLQGIADVESLWRGDTIERINGAGKTISIRTYPTPIQPRLPVWLTAASNPETFRLAGERGYGVLTHLFHHDIDSLKEKISLYRAARQLAGHSDPQGQVAVTLHAFVAESLDAVRRDAGEAYCHYLKANLGLLKHLAFSHGRSTQIENLPKVELDQLIGWTLDKFIGGRSLMGTIDSCTATCAELAQIGVSEVACLLDFGPSADDILNRNLPSLACLQRNVAGISVLSPGSSHAATLGTH